MGREARCGFDQSDSAELLRRIVVERWLVAVLIIEVIGIVILFPLLHRKLEARQRSRSETINRIYRATLLARHSPPSTTHRKRQSYFR
jgi:hypothetical protein